MLAHHRATPGNTDLPRGTHSHTWEERGTARVKTLQARSGVIFLCISCVFQAKARQARAACEERRAPPPELNSHFELASLSPLFSWNTQKITPVLQAKTLPKTTTQCPRPDSEPRPLNLKLSTLTKCEYHREVYPRERTPYKDDRLRQWIFRVAREVAHYSGWRVVLNVQFLLVKSLPVSIRVVHAHHVTHLLVSTTPR